MASSPFELIDGDYVGLIQQLEKEQLQRLNLSLTTQNLPYEASLRKASKRKINQKKSFNQNTLFKKFSKKEQAAKQPRSHTFLIISLCVISIFMIGFIGSILSFDPGLIVFLNFVCIIICIASLQNTKNKKGLKKVSPKLK